MFGKRTNTQNWSVVNERIGEDFTGTARVAR